VRRHWPDILRVVGFIYTGAVLAYDVLRMLQRDGHPTPLGEAIRDLRSKSLPGPPRTVIPRLEKCLYCGACVVRQHTWDSTWGGRATSRSGLASRKAVGRDNG
jgi:hypothetical protein